jgi:hypothetical protein
MTIGPPIDVSLTALEASLWQIQISEVPERRETNAILVPSGE